MVLSRGQAKFTIKHGFPHPLLIAAQRNDQRACGCLPTYLCLTALHLCVRGVHINLCCGSNWH